MLHSTSSATCSTMAITLCKTTAYLPIARGCQAVAEPSGHGCDEERRVVGCFHDPVLCAALWSVATWHPPELRQAVVAEREQRPIHAHNQRRVQRAADLCRCKIKACTPATHSALQGCTRSREVLCMPLITNSTSTLHSLRTRMLQRNTAQRHTPERFCVHACLAFTPLRALIFCGVQTQLWSTSCSGTCAALPQQQAVNGAHRCMPVMPSGKKMRPLSHRS